MSASNLIAMLLALVGLILSAQLSLDLSLGEVNIPITGQTLGVILLSYFLPKYQGVYVVLIYLLLAAFGVPILADWSGGFDKFTGGSAGFLIGFVFAAIFVSRQSLNHNTGNFIQLLLLNSIATLIILFFGNAWLMYNYGWADGLKYGFIPFWPGALIKVILGVGIIYFLAKKNHRN